MPFQDEKTAMANLETAARQHYATQKADGRIPAGHPQREDLERKQEAYEQAFNSTILSLFDKVLFPIHRSGKEPQLIAKTLDQTRDGEKPFNGEEQIEKTLTAVPQKLYLDVEASFDTLKEKAQDLLWPEGLDETRWTDAVDLPAEPGEKSAQRSTRQCTVESISAFRSSQLRAPPGRLHRTRRSRSRMGRGRPWQ